MYMYNTCNYTLLSCKVSKIVLISLHITQEGTDSDASAATPSPDLVAPVLTTKEKLHVKERVWFRVKNFALGLWAAVLSITFIFTVVAMMVCCAHAFLWL